MRNAAEESQIYNLSIFLDDFHGPAPTLQTPLFPAQVATTGGMAELLEPLVQNHPIPENIFNDGIFTKH